MRSSAIVTLVLACGGAGFSLGYLARGASGEAEGAPPADRGAVVSSTTSIVPANTQEGVMSRDAGTIAWENGALSRAHYEMLDAGKVDRVKAGLAENLWVSIPVLDRVSNDPEEPERRKKAARRSLQKAAAFFAKHPRETEYEEESQLSNEVEKGVGERIADERVGEREETLMREMVEKMRPSLEATEEFIDALAEVMRERDKGIQAILDKVSESE